MKKVLALGLITFTSLTVISQEKVVVDELFGFKLGQYKSVVDNQLGESDAHRYMNDSSLVNFYYVQPDSSTHVAFQFLPHRDEIYSIQLTGTKNSIDFYGINLGDKTELVESKFDKPDTIFVVEFYGEEVHTWKYFNKNLSFVFKDSKLNSIKIWDNFSGTESDTELPGLLDYLEVIKSGDRSAISDILSPNMEIFYCDYVFSWKNSFRKDITENAAIYKFVVDPQTGLALLNNLDSIPAELNLRFIENYGSFPVYKLPDGYIIKEVVFNYQQGKYKIWEIKYECLEEN